MNPSTLIHRPFMNAVIARATTKFGNTEETKTTNDSAARRSRNSHMTQVMNAANVGLKFESQYAMMENIKEIITIAGE